MNCTNPRVIRNPRAAKLLENGYRSVIDDCGRVRYYHVSGTSLSALWKTFSMMPTIENAPKYSLFDPETGDAQPLFYVVPCGKCILCKTRKKKELAARAILEGNQYDNPPLFLTFTYAPKFLPEGNELDRRAMPLFLKRLRSRLKYYNIPYELAYMYCGEYGAKYGRAHYHMVLWNFPQNDVHFPTIMQVIRFIQRCWSVFKMEIGDDGKMHRVPMRNAKKEIIRYPSGNIVYETEPIGIVQVKPVTQTDGCISYVTKYMRKEGRHNDEHKQKPFYYGSSKRQGIGSAGIKDLAAFIKSNPDMTSVPVKDKFTGKIENLPITSYVKEKVWRSYSTLLRSKEMETVREFYVERENFLSASLLLRRRLGLNAVAERSYNNSEGRIITYKYYDDPYLDFISPWHKTWHEAYLKTSWYVKNSSVVDFETFGDNKTIYSNDYLWNFLATVADRLTILSNEILAMPDIRALSLQRDNELRERSLTIQSRLCGVLKPDASVLAEKLKAAEKRAELREIF